MSGECFEEKEQCCLGVEEGEELIKRWSVFSY